jgi:hypothetical protein
MGVGSPPVAGSVNVTMTKRISWANGPEVIDRESSLSYRKKSHSQLLRPQWKHRKAKQAVV